MKTLTTWLSFLFLISIFNSCKTTESVAKGISIESGEIPPDMAKEDFTLLAATYTWGGYDKVIKREIEKYTGKYVLVSVEGGLSKQYQDVSKYRYLMAFDSNFGTGAGGGTVAVYRYYILDRKDNKKYMRKARSSNYPQEIRAYLQAIDAVRKK